MTQHYSINEKCPCPCEQCLELWQRDEEGRDFVRALAEMEWLELPEETPEIPYAKLDPNSPWTLSLVKYWPALNKLANE